MENVADYVAPMQIGDIMRGTGIGEVIESNNPDMPVGSLWSGMTGWTEHFVTDGKGSDAVESELEPTASLSVLGLTGMTAWCGLVQDWQAYRRRYNCSFRCRRRNRFDCWTTSKINAVPCDRHCRWRRKMCLASGRSRFRRKHDYKNENVKERLRELAPKGANIVYDNVGGKILDDMLANICHPCAHRCVWRD